MNKRIPKHPEYDLQKEVCSYLRLQYPDVLFLSDTIANLRLLEPQKRRNKAIQNHNFACPDLIILETTQKYKGLFIELKVDSPFLKDGKTLKKKKVTIKKGSIIIGSYDHNERQQKSIDKLNLMGYYACFSWGFDMTKKIIDDYLDGI